MRYVIIGGSAAAIGCIEGVRSVDTNRRDHSHYRRDGVELFPSAHFVSAGGQDHAGQNVVPAGQLFYPERCDGESRRAGHRAGCRRQDRAALRQASGWLTTGCWRPRAAARSCRPFPGWKRWSVPFASRRCPTPRLWLRRCGRRAACSFWARASRASNAPRASAACARRSPLRTLRPACCLLYWMTRRLPWCRPVWRRRASIFYLNDSAAAFRGTRPGSKAERELEFDVLVTAVGVRPEHAAGGGRRRRGGPGHPRWTAAVPPRFPMYMLRETAPRDTTR